MVGGWAVGRGCRPQVQLQVRLQLGSFIDHMFVRWVALSLLCIAVPAGEARGQRPYGVGPSLLAAPQFVASPSFPRQQPTPLARHRYSHWMEGAALGAGLLGTTAGYLYYGLCEVECRWESAALMTLSGGAVGATIGMLVGAIVPAARPRPFRGRPALGTLVGATLGGAWAFGVMTQLCQGGCSAFEVRFGVTTILVGGSTGYLLSTGIPRLP